MKRESVSGTGTVVIVLDGDTDAGFQLTRCLLDEGCRVVLVVRHPTAGVRAMHGLSFDRLMVIAADVDDHRQWGLLTERVTSRFGRVDTVVRAKDVALRATA